MKEKEIHISKNMLGFVDNSHRICAPNLRVVQQADGYHVAMLDIIIEREPNIKTNWKESKMSSVMIGLF